MVDPLIRLSHRSKTNCSFRFSNISKLAAKPTLIHVDYICLKIKKKSKGRFRKMNSPLMKNKIWGMLLTLYCINVMMLPLYRK